MIWDIASSQTPRCWHLPSKVQLWYKLTRFFSFIKLFATAKTRVLVSVGKYTGKFCFILNVTPQENNNFPAKQLLWKINGRKTLITDSSVQCPRSWMAPSHHINFQRSIMSGSVEMSSDWEWCTDQIFLICPCHI